MGWRGWGSSSLSSLRIPLSKSPSWSFYPVYVPRHRDHRVTQVVGRVDAPRPPLSLASHRNVSVIKVDFRAAASTTVRRVWSSLTMRLMVLDCVSRNSPRFSTKVSQRYPRTLTRLLNHGLDSTLEVTTWCPRLTGQITTGRMSCLSLNIVLASSLFNTLKNHSFRLKSLCV